MNCSHPFHLWTAQGIHHGAGSWPGKGSFLTNLLLMQPAWFSWFASKEALLQWLAHTLVRALAMASTHNRQEAITAV